MKRSFWRVLKKKYSTVAFELIGSDTRKPRFLDFLVKLEFVLFFFTQTPPLTN